MPKYQLIKRPETSSRYLRKVGGCWRHDRRRFGRVVAGCAQLKDLEVDLTDQAHRNRGSISSWTDIPWVSSLRRLELRVDTLSSDCWAFINTQASTLETLDLEIRDLQSGKSIPLDGPPFPLLTHLFLAGTNDEAPFDAFDPNPDVLGTSLPPLREIRAEAHLRLRVRLVIPSLLQKAPRQLTSHYSSTLRVLITRESKVLENVQ